VFCVEVEKRCSKSVVVFVVHFVFGSCNVRNQKRVSPVFGIMFSLVRIVPVINRFAVGICSDVTKSLASES
jgi:hypothetical protein